MSRAKKTAELPKPGPEPLLSPHDLLKGVSDQTSLRKLQKEIKEEQAKHE